MIGIVLVGHCRIGEEFLNVIKLIVGEVENCRAVYFDPAEDPDVSLKKISKAIKSVDSKEGVIVLTDMFGGTPSNLSLSFLKEAKVEVLTGMNLPMLVRLITIRNKKISLLELAEDLKAYGQKNICLASEILNGN